MSSKATRRHFTIPLALALATSFVAGPVLAVQFQTATTIGPLIERVTVVAVGPEDPDPTSNADGAVYGVNGQTGAVWRVRFNSSKTVLDQLKVIDLNGSGSTGSVNAVLGIAFDPSSHAGGPIRLYLAYADDNTAPFNGKIARAVSTNGGVSYTVAEDFITGLPRSDFNHQTNGVAFGPDGCLYIAQGGNSNVGYHPNLAESRMSGTILRACFNLSNGGLDPAFDGNCGSGNTQEACSVKVYASGLRNPYDLVWHSNGFLYSTDNDASGPGADGGCAAPGNAFGCPCQVGPATQTGDEINLIEQGKYYGSPNPYLANPWVSQCQGGTEGGDSCGVGDPCPGGMCSNLASLCTTADSGLCDQDVQCLFLHSGATPTSSQDPTNLYRGPINTPSPPNPNLWLDGIAEYRSPFGKLIQGGFCSDWNGHLLVAPIGPEVRRFTLSANGQTATDQGEIGFGAKGLDVAVGADGTAYFATVDDGVIQYIRPIAQPTPQAAHYYKSCAPRQTCRDNTCQPVCVSDCNVNNVVAINELVTAVAISLGNTPLVPGCPASDANNNGSVMISELIQGVNNSLNGCGGGGISGFSALSTVTIDVGSGTGLRGGSVTIPITVAGGGGAVAGAQVDILYSQAAFSISNPSTSCFIASRLQATHQETASLPTTPAAPSGKKRLRVIVMPSFSSVGGFTDGLIASCTFQISPSATIGTHTLNAERQEAGGSAGSTIGSVADNGSISVQ